LGRGRHGRGRGFEPRRPRHRFISYGIYGNRSKSFKSQCARSRREHLKCKRLLKQSAGFNVVVACDTRMRVSFPCLACQRRFCGNKLRFWIVFAVLFESLYEIVNAHQVFMPEVFSCWAISINMPIFRRCSLNSNAGRRSPGRQGYQLTGSVHGLYPPASTTLYP
jgi:hypothetical protein